MKNRKTTICIFTALLLAAAPGCGNSADQTSDTSAVKEVSGTQTTAAREEDDSQAADQAVSNEIDHNTADSASLQDSETADTYHPAEETISGNIKSIGDNSIVLSKSENISDNEMSIPADGSPDEELVTVRFSADTKFMIATVKNSGVNGDSDVDVREGNFSDLTEQSSLDLTGSYEGEDFQASSVILYIFI